MSISCLLTFDFKFNKNCDRLVVRTTAIRYDDLQSRVHLRINVSSLLYAYEGLDETLPLYVGILIKSDLFERAKFKKVFIMKCFLHVLLDFCSALSYFMEYGVQVSRTVNPIICSNFVIVNVHFIKAI